MKVSIEEAIALLKKGHIVALPTETVYGLAAPMGNFESIEKIYQIKGRPPIKPLTICMASIDHAKLLGKNIPESFYELGKKYWPGPLTLVIEANTQAILPIIRASEETIGLRIPNDETTLKIIEEVGPIVLPSANLSGEAPLNSLREIEEVFGKEFPICEGKGRGSGISSTVAEYKQGQWVILRQGTCVL